MIRLPRARLPSVRSSGRRRRGTVLMLSAMGIVSLVLTAGFAVDATRVWLVRTRVQHAVDAAALMGAYQIGKSTQVADTKAMFWVNYSAGAASTGIGYLGSTSSGATVTQVDSFHVSVSAWASVPTTFMQIGGLSNTTVAAATAVAAKSSGYEIALVLDITGSMTASASGMTKIQALKNAAQNMLDVIYGSNDTLSNLAVSVVPFRGSVNMGSSRTGWLTGYNASDWTLQAWRGCVEARTGGYDITEDNPGVRKFTALRYASTYRAPTTTTYYGDNDWYSGRVTDTGNGATSSSQYNAWSYLPVGPNFGCSNSPMLPLTASKTTVNSTISSMVAASGGGTIIPQGLQWAWFTLSPQWQSYWGLSNAPSGAARPLAYNTPANYKVVILMTDGNNQWDGNSAVAQPNYRCQSYNVFPECNRVDGYYNSYGRLSGRAMPAAAGARQSAYGIASETASQRAGAALDTRTSTLCTAMKNKGIIIYTIGFQAAAGSDSEAVLKGCASDDAHYYNTNTGDDIDAAFQSIGQQLISLRLTQ